MVGKILLQVEDRGRIWYVDFNGDRHEVTFVNGLTMERVKLHYHWLLNAKVKDVIVGEDEYGLVWYFGDWFSGEWLDGTWYSGRFFEGNWNNGKWFSYKLNKFDISFFIRKKS